MREAHPIDGSAPSTFGLIEDPIDDTERTHVASTCVEELRLPMPALVDRIDDKVGLAYAGWPDRLYLIGKDGKIAYAGERGPRGFDPDAWAKAIETETARGSKGEPPRGGGQKTGDHKVDEPAGEPPVTKPPVTKPPKSG